MKKFVTLNEVLPTPKKNGTAIGHFNLNGQLWAEAILRGAETSQQPVIVATSDRMVDFLGGFKLVRKMVEELMEIMDITVPVVLHLDHGQTVARCKEAIEAGYSSVMFDGSHSPLVENIALTKEVVDYAHERGCSVEAEIGTVGGVEDGLVGGINYADFDECLALVRETGVDALAAALGSVHGRYVGEPKLGFKEMAQLSENLETPLVLHGASGLPDEQVQKAIALGHAKINVNTELNLAWKAELERQLILNGDSHEPRVFLTPCREAMTEVVMQKIKLFSQPSITE